MKSSVRPMSQVRDRWVANALRKLAPHFGHPHGAAGYVAGLLMMKSNQTIAGQVVATVGPLDGLDVLDVGCGPGNAVCEAITRASPASVTGVDPSPEMLRLARRRVRHRNGSTNIRLA